MNTKLSHRSLAIAALVTPLALLLSAHGTAADPILVLNPAALSGTASFGGLIITSVYAEATATNGLNASGTFSLNPPGYSLVVEDDTAYTQFVRANLLTNNANVTRSIAVNRSTPVNVAGDTIANFSYPNVSRVQGNVSVTGGVLIDYTLYAFAPGAGETYSAQDREYMPSPYPTADIYDIWAVAHNQVQVYGTARIRTNSAVTSACHLPLVILIYSILMA